MDKIEVLQEDLRWWKEKAGRITMSLRSISLRITFRSDYYSYMDIPDELAKLLSPVIEQYYTERIEQLLLELSEL